MLYVKCAYCGDSITLPDSAEYENNVYCYNCFLKDLPSIMARENKLITSEMETGGII